MANYNAIKYNGFSKGTLKLIKTLTASSSATLSFVNGASDVVLDSTYKEYIFIFNDIHPATNSVNFQFNMSADGGSNYNVTKTTTHFRAYHNESGTEAVLEYYTSGDLAQSTSNHMLLNSTGNGNDESCSGYLHIFNPSDTTFVKHFIANFNNYNQGDYSMNHFSAGYGNTTSAVDAIQFSFSSGNIDAGTVQLFGVT
tara:strand:+ start:63 stop:656 length:594 start_codon:yes stop_codon:yes gene_type:complete